MKKALLISTLFLIGIFFGCQQKTNLKEEPNLKIYINSKGQIFSNNKLTSLFELDKMFDKLSETNGIIYYSRDNIQNEPTLESMKAMELIVKHELSVKFFTDKTFTEIIKLN